MESTIAGVRDLGGGSALVSLYEPPAAAAPAPAPAPRPAAAAPAPAAAASPAPAASPATSSPAYVVYHHRLLVAGYRVLMRAYVVSCSLSR